MRIPLYFAAQIIALLLLPAIVRAVPVAVVNSGFEDISGESTSGEFTFGPLNGWDLYETGNDTSGGDGPQFFIGTLTPTAPVFFTDGAYEGDRVGIAFNFSGTGNVGEYGMQQVLSTTLAANTSYTLNVQIGNIASGTATSNSFFDLDGFPGYRIDLMTFSELGGFTILESDDNSLGGSIAEGEFGLSTVSFTTSGTHAQLGETLAIRLVNLNVIDPSAPGADREVDFDDVSLNAEAVPEPSILLSLFLAGCLLPILLARQTRNRRHLPVPVPLPTSPPGQPASRGPTRHWRGD